ncbi:phosphatase PAP2 family protein [Cohnella caldifontis]|uniref:phosphatase PAP2 family protein n=1 Tax=Cohnella caldifontis TaxID=3027471 RepID=UPI0023ECDE85|nr:phosphatase PAP2 family protein [Cohnella sp. YIM B05605]
MYWRRFEWRKYAPLALMLVFPVLGMLYGWTNTRPTADVYSLVTDFDRATPFIKYFALPYSVWIFYIYACLVYFFKKDVNLYYKGLAIYTICALTCYLVYMVFQTTVPRPEITGGDPFSLLMNFIYERDRPFNCFPSIHCFSSYMVMRLLWGSSFKNRWNMILITGMSSTIILSTLFIKQHVILDALAGVLLVEFVLAGMTIVETQLKESRQRQRQKRTFGA